MNVFKRLYSRYIGLGERSKKSMLNIISSFGAKGSSVLVSLLIVPMTINYVNATQYGIWLTLSSIISWIGFFDFGLGNGMRNKFAEAKAEGDVKLANQYVSTTYFVIGFIVLLLFLFIEVINLYLNWASILKIDVSYNNELRKVFAILTAFFCLNMVVRLFTSLLTADQKPGLSSWIGVIGQLFSLIAIYLLTITTDGSLVKLAAYSSGIPTIVLLLVSIYAFRFTSYRQYAPKKANFERSLIKDIMGIGMQFFIIYMCLLVVFQIINVVISRELGPEAVTEYNIAYKYFNIAHSVLTIIIVPFWSAFTEAYHKDDYRWMRNVKRTLEIVWLCEIVVIVGMTFLSDWFYHVWVGESVNVGKQLSIIMAVFFAFQSLGSIYMYMINGIGTIRLQLIIYVLFAIIALPSMQLSCRLFGLVGILIVPTLVFVFQSVVGKIQLEKILNRSNSGIWAK